MVSGVLKIGLGLAMLVLGGTVARPATAASSEAIWYNCLTREVFTPEKQAWCSRWNVLQNATYVVPASLDEAPDYVLASLNLGRYQSEDGKLLVELVNERNWISFGDINEDGKQDAAVVFGVALDPQGQEVGTFLTVVLDVDGTAEALTPVRLGNRIMLNGPITIGDHRVTVPFLTQAEVMNRHYGIKGTALVLL